jgi:ribonucleoside-diphosphate reductase alpha chain
MFKTKLAQEVWESKYRYGDETPLGTFERVARAVASVEKDPDYWYPRFLKTLVKFELGPALYTQEVPEDLRTKPGDVVRELIPVGLKATFGGRITANAGTHYTGTTLMNCFINGPVSDARISYYRSSPGLVLSTNPALRDYVDVDIMTEETPDNLANIFLSLLEAAETLKSEGGYGMNFSFIRPRGSIIKGVGIKHPGVVRYLSLWDTMADVIVMGDNDGYRDQLQNLLDTDAGTAQKIGDKIKKMARKGAMMAVLDVSHPDIEEFVRAKQTPGVLTKFNISVLVDDAFMSAVYHGETYDLTFNGEVHKRVRARDLYDLIMQSTYNRAEPGILFRDTMNLGNPLAYLGEVNATNPCGEIPGNADISTVCLLGSLNLPMYVNPDRSFDWDTYSEDVMVFARMLDNINDLSHMPLPQYEWAMRNIRQYGMGVNGEGSALYMLGISYGSPQHLLFNQQINFLKENLSWQASALLAKEKGTFPAFSQRFFETEWYKNAELLPRTRELMETYGVRNGKTTTNPPLGNSSVLCDNVSNGIEPVFAHSYNRTYIVSEWPLGLNRDNIKEFFQEVKQGDATVWQGEWLGVRYHYEPHNRGLCAIEVVEDYGYRWVRENYPEEFWEYDDPHNGADAIIPGYMVTAGDLSVMDHVRVQATVQRNVNQSISKTINVPNDYPFEDFKQLYIEGWRQGLVGITTYREGSMESVLSRVEEAKFTRGTEIIRRDLKLPDEFINGPMKVIKREGQKFYLHFSYLPEDIDQIFPVVLWIKTNNHGTIKQANAVVSSVVELLESYGIDHELLLDQRAKLYDTQVPSDRVARIISMALRHNVPIPNIVAALDRVPDVFVTDLVFVVKKFLSEQVEDGTPVQGVSCSACQGSQVIFESGCTKCLDCGASNCG